MSEADKRNPEYDPMPGDVMAAEQANGYGMNRTVEFVDRDDNGKACGIQYWAEYENRDDGREGYCSLRAWRRWCENYGAWIEHAEETHG